MPLQAPPPRQPMPNNAAGNAAQAAAGAVVTTGKQIGPTTDNLSQFGQALAGVNSGLQAAIQAANQFAREMERVTAAFKLPTLSLPSPVSAPGPTSLQPPKTALPSPPPTPTSPLGNTSAFSRPIPVIVVGPKPTVVPPSPSAAPSLPTTPPNLTPPPISPPPTPTSPLGNTSAFSRPIPVIVVGPKPLPVSSAVAGSPVSSPRGPLGNVPAFDRPIPVIVMGPRPLPVSGAAGGGGSKPPTDDDGGSSRWLTSLRRGLESLAQKALVAGTAIVVTASHIARAGETMLHLPVAALNNAIASVSANIGSFVQKASPGHMLLFNRAVDDLQASIGRALIPVIVKATEIFRAIGSAIFGMNGNGQKFIAAIVAGSTGLGVFAAILGGVAVVAGTATVALLAFSAAIAVVEAIASGGAMVPVLAAIGASLTAIGAAGTAGGAVLAAVAGSVSGIVAAFSDLKPVLAEMAPIITGVGEVVGSAMQSLVPALMPLVRLAGQFVGAFAGAIAFVSRQVEALAPVFAILSHVMEQVFIAIQPLLGDALVGVMTTIVSGMALAIGQLALGLAPLAAAFTVLGTIVMHNVLLIGKAVRYLGGLLGIKMPDLTPPKGEVKDNTGAAARNVVTSSVDDVLKKARESAFSIGTAAQTEDYNKTIAKNTKDIVEKVEAILKWLDEKKQEAENFGEKAKTVGEGVATVIAPGAVTAVRGALDLADEGYKRAKDLFGF